MVLHPLMPVPLALTVLLDYIPQMVELVWLVLITHTLEVEPAHVVLVLMVTIVILHLHVCHVQLDLIQLEVLLVPHVLLEHTVVVVPPYHVPLVVVVATQRPIPVPVLNV